MLEQRITDDMKIAMKARDKKALSAIRMLKSAIKDKQIEFGRSPDDQEVMVLIGKLVKQRKDAAQQYADAGRADLQASELAEAELYSAYLPEPLTQAEVDAILEAVMQETGASGMKDMGKVMGALGSRVQGRADMGQLSAMVKSRLAG